VDALLRLSQWLWHACRGQHDFFTEACCKGTELIEGWYWYEDDGDNVGGPFEDEEDAILAAENGIGWANAKQ
jgi:hypothetical protein